MMSLEPQLFHVYVMIFISFAWFVQQQQHPLIQLPGDSSGQCSLTWGCCKCCVPLGRGLRSRAFHIHQPHITAALSWRWWIKQLLCDFFWETSSPLPSLKNFKEPGKMHPSRVAKVPSCPGRAPVPLVLGLCHVQALSNSCMPDPVGSDPHCHWSCFWDLSVLHYSTAQIFSSANHHY